MHQLAILGLQQHAPAIRTQGFSAAVHRLIAAYTAATWSRPEDRAADQAALTALFRRARVLPDAYEIGGPEVGALTLTIYEVEDRNALTVEKMLGICALWWLLDAMAGDLRVFVLDRYGQNRRELDVWIWERNYWRTARRRA